MMKNISYYAKGTTVYYFSGLELSLKETIVENISINIDEAGDAVVTYTLDSGRKNVASIKVEERHVFDDREVLKKKVLANFGSKVIEPVVKAPVEADKRL